MKKKKLIQEFIKSNELKTAGDIQEAIKGLFKDTIQYKLKLIKAVDIHDIST